MASMLLPRPEMTTATGSSDSFFDDHAARAARDAADHARGFAASPRACASAASTSAGATTAIMPMPQLKVRYISAAAIVAGGCQPVEHRIACPAAPLQHDFEAVRQHARNVVGEAAARDVREAFARAPCCASASIDFT